MEEILNIFQDKLNYELKDLDGNSLYEEIDIFGSIKEYDILQNYISDINVDEKKRNTLEKILEKTEKLCLKKNRIIKLKGEDKSYYCLTGEVYDSNGELISDYYEECLDEDNIFCEYNGDNIYNYMKKLLEKKIQKQIYASYNRCEY